jgi:hypothetical protein
MKRIILAVVVLFSWGAHADDPPPSPFLSGDALAAEVARNCAEGCVVLNPAEAALLMHSIQQMVDEREKAAFVKGARSCRNAI